MGDVYERVENKTDHRVDIHASKIESPMDKGGGGSRFMSLNTQNPVRNANKKTNSYIYKEPGKTQKRKEFRRRMEQ